VIAPKTPFVKDGQILSANLINSMIARTEYAADLLRQYKLIAGNEMYIEPHNDGTRVSHLQPVYGGASGIIFSRLVIPPNDLIPPINPPLLKRCEKVNWSINNLTFTPPYTPPKTGYIVSNARWKKVCLNNTNISPKSSFSLDADDGGNFGSFIFPNVPGPSVPTVTQTGIVAVNASSYDNDTFYLWVEWLVFDLWGGGFGLKGSGQFGLD
jgi:hypothetical protein